LDFFDSLKQSLIFVLSCSTKILALLTARLALQGFAGDLIPFEVGLFTVVAQRFPALVSAANRAAASKATRCFCHRQRFAAFPLELPRKSLWLLRIPLSFLTV